ncbi:unnamed protein product, partial [Thlaspi arvense]
MQMPEKTLERISDVRKELSIWKKGSDMNSNVRKELSIWKKGSDMNSKVQRVINEISKLSKMSETKLELMKAMEEEKAFWQQKSDEKLLNVEDKNSRFFHNSVKTSLGRILKLPLGNIQDKYIWAYTKHGSYAVKSGCWLVANHPAIPKPQPAARKTERRALKQWIWALKTSPKIKMIFWRFLSGALVVSKRLQRRNIPVDSDCKLCNKGPKIICYFNAI